MTFRNTELPLIFIIIRLPAVMTLKNYIFNIFIDNFSLYKGCRVYNYNLRDTSAELIFKSLPPLSTISLPSLATSTALTEMSFS